MDTLFIRLFGSLYVWVISNLTAFVTAKCSGFLSIQPIMQEISVLLGVLSGLVLLISSIQLMRKRKLDMDRQRLEIEKEILEIEELKKKCLENESN